MYDLPTSVEISGVEYELRNQGDFRTILSAFAVLNDEELTKDERVLCALLIFYDVDNMDDILAIPDMEDAVKKMFDFMNLGQPEKHGPNYKVIDWEDDAPIIISAINNVAGKEVRAESFVHWWTFMGYFMAIGESTFATVVSIRSKILKDKKLEKWERQFRNENPQYFEWNHKTADDLEAEAWLKEVWNKE